MSEFRKIQKWDSKRFESWKVEAPVGGNYVASWKTTVFSPSGVWYVALRLLRKTVFSMSFVSAKVVVEGHNSCKNCREVDGRCTVWLCCLPSRLTELTLHPSCICRFCLPYRLTINGNSWSSFGCCLENKQRRGWVARCTSEYLTSTHRLFLSRRLRLATTS